MNDKCEIVRDLMPLYVDGVCSNASKELVENHFEECAECEAEYKKLVDQSVNISVSDDDTQAIKKAGKKLKKTKKKSLIKGIAATLVSLIVIGILFFPDLMVNYAKNRYVYRHQQITMNISNRKDGKIKVGKVKLNVPENYTSVKNALPFDIKTVIGSDENVSVTTFVLTNPNELKTTTNQKIIVYDANTNSSGEALKLNFTSENSGGQGALARFVDKIGVRELGFGEDDYSEFMNYLYSDKVPEYKLFSSFKKKAAVFACYDCLYYMTTESDGRFTFATDSYKCYGYARSNGFDEDVSFSPCTYNFVLYDKDLVINMIGFTKYEAEYIMSSLVFE